MVKMMSAAAGDRATTDKAGSSRPENVNVVAIAAIAMTSTVVVVVMVVVVDTVATIATDRAVGLVAVMETTTTNAYVVVVVMVVGVAAAVGATTATRGTIATTVDVEAEAVVATAVIATAPRVRPTNSTSLALLYRLAWPRHFSPRHRRLSTSHLAMPTTCPPGVATLSSQGFGCPHLRLFWKVSATRCHSNKQQRQLCEPS